MIQVYGMASELERLYSPLRASNDFKESVVVKTSPTEEMPANCHRDKFKLGRHVDKASRGVGGHKVGDLRDGVDSSFFQASRETVIEG